MSRKGALLPSFFRKGRESMKKKYVSAMVLTALLGAQLCAGQVQAETIEDPAVSGIFVGSGEAVSEDLSNVSISKDSDGKAVYGVLVTNGSTLNADNDNITVSAKNTGTGKKDTSVVGIGAETVGGEGQQYPGGTANIGTENTQKITINATATQSRTYATGLSVLQGDENGGKNPSHMVVKGHDLEINVTHEDESGMCSAVGIFVQNSTSDKNISDADRSSVVIDTDRTVIHAVNPAGSAVGIQAMSQGKVDINSDLEIYAGSEDGTIRGDAIYTRGYAITNINTDGQHSTKLYGNINFGYYNTTGVDAKVNLNLTGKDSVWVGNSLVSGNAHDPELMKVNGFHVDINDGAQWTTDGNSFVNTLSMDGGIINMVGDDTQTLDLYTVDGSGTVNMNTEKTADGFSAGTLNVNSVTDGKTARLGVNFMGINADDISTDKTKQQEQLNALAGNVKFGTGISKENLTATANVGEGLITGAISAGMATNNATGGSSIVEGSVHQNNSTTTMENMKNIAAVSIAAWRQEDSTLSQRLGDLRETTGGQGIWARVSRGEFEYSGEFKNQYNYFQIGWDMAKNDWHYGAAVSYNDGETTYSDGNGENSSTSLSLYGTRLLNDGQYFDIVLKAGRLNNKYDNYAAAGHTHGDYDAWGTEISGEYGKKIDLANDWFVTPQAQLSLMRIGSEDYTTSNGIHVDQDTLYSAVGRIGAEAGKKTAWGSLYAKASILHDFAGDADTYLTYRGLSNSYSQDIGDTWYEAGFGANWKMSDSSYLYVDVIRTFGGDIKTPWQWNAGVRWGF